VIIEDLGSQSSLIKEEHVRFGVVLPTYPAGATVEGVVQVAQAAERLGFSSIWTTDHVILPPDQAGPYAEILEPLLTLAYVAPLTSRVRLGISVIVVPQRNGIVLAKELATLDRLCHGRLIVGVGAGWSKAEFQMLGAGDRFHHRGAYLDETLRLWQHLWTVPDTPFQGMFYDVPAAAFGPCPLQPGGPPIWVGGSSPGARRRAGTLGSAWHPVGISAVDLAEQAELVQEAANQAGREMPALAPRLPLQFGAASEALAVGPMQMIDGSPEEVVMQVSRYADAGARELICLFNSPHGPVVVEQMELLAKHVMPAPPDEP
jgi:probable F420-dependent oxidoreductase